MAFPLRNNRLFILILNQTLCLRINDKFYDYLSKSLIYVFSEKIKLVNKRNGIESFIKFDCFEYARSLKPYQSSTRFDYE